MEDDKADKFLRLIASLIVQVVLKKAEGKNAQSDKEQDRTVEESSSQFETNQTAKIPIF